MFVIRKDIEISTEERPGPRHMHLQCHVIQLAKLFRASHTTIAKSPSLQRRRNSTPSRQTTSRDCTSKTVAMASMYRFFLLHCCPSLVFRQFGYAQPSRPQPRVRSHDRNTLKLMQKLTISSIESKNSSQHNQSKKAHRNGYLILKSQRGSYRNR
jgi:hypothetical protein